MEELLPTQAGGRIPLCDLLIKFQRPWKSGSGNSTGEPSGLWGYAILEAAYFVNIMCFC
jgi:hypothetical protein